MSTLSDFKKGWITMNGAHVFVDDDKGGAGKPAHNARKPASPSTPKEDRVVSSKEVRHSLSDLNHPAGKKLMEDEDFVNGEYKDFNDLEQAVRDKVSPKELQELTEPTPGSPGGDLKRVFDTKRFYDSPTGPFILEGKDLRHKLYETKKNMNKTFFRKLETSYDEKIAMYMQKLGISEAGPVPNSLLAAQDLEGEDMSKMMKRMDLWLWRQDKQSGGQEIEFKSTKNYDLVEKGTDLNSFSVWYYDKGGAQKCAVFGHAIDAIAYAKIVDAMGYKNVQILKGQFEQAGKQLKEAAESAEDADEKETKSLVERIKSAQIKRQKTVLSMREPGVQKSFKEKWGEISRAPK